MRTYIVSLYQADDAKQLSEMLKQCAVATNQLGENYFQFHKEILPAAQKSISAAHTLVVQLEKPSQMMYSVACFNYSIPKTKKSWPFFDTEVKYPFESWQEPIRTFRNDTRPNVEKALKSSSELLNDFENNTSPQISKTFPQINDSLNKVSVCIAKQENLNQNIANSIRALGIVCSLLLFITGIYHFRQSENKA